MKLSKQEIQFIDNYLINSNIVYVDIRQEMLDHIATALEEKISLENIDFYDAFKDYMIINKSELLNKYHKNWLFSWSTLKKFAHFLLQPFMLIFGIVLYFGLKKINIFPFFSPSFTFKNLVFISILTVFIVQLCYFRLYLKKRFYYIEKIGFIVILLYYAQAIFLPNQLKETSSVVFTSTYIFVILGYIIFFIRETIKFKTRSLY